MRPLPLVCLAALTAGSFSLIGCSTAPDTPQARHELTNDSRAEVSDLTTQDPSLNDLLKNSYGYAVFPTIGKGEVWSGGKRVGFTDMTEATIGASLGGQTFSELIVFRTPAALQKFEYGQYTFDASVSAVAVAAGAANQARWSDDVAVFIDPKGGLMADASIGSQKFAFTALAPDQQNPQQ